MEKLHSLLLVLPARRVAADTKKHTWWAFGAVLVVVIGPILILSLVSSVGTLVALGAFLAACVMAVVCWFVGTLRGTVVVPRLDDDAIEEKTRKRARDTLKVSVVRYTGSTCAHP